MNEKRFKNYQRYNAYSCNSIFDLCDDASRGWQHLLYFRCADRFRNLEGILCGLYYSYDRALRSIIFCKAKYGEHKMKRLVALTVIAGLCLCCLVSCGASYTKNEFFSDEFLTQNKLEDMPKPPHLDGSVFGSDSLSGDVLYLDLTDEEYEGYVENLLNYLRVKEDIYYLGYSVGSGLLGEMLPYDEIAPITDTYNVKENKHNFFFATDERLGNWDSLNSPVEFAITRESGKLEFGNFAYNTTIRIRSGDRARAVWNPCGAEHTYDCGIEYRIAGSDKTVTEYTCVNCGSTELSDFIGDMKIYNITVEDTENVIIDPPAEGVSGCIYRIKAHIIIDADLKFTANGTEIYPRQANDGEWVYEFVMPCEDVVIIAEIVGGSSEERT